MHSFLLKLDSDMWVFLKDYSKRSGRTVSGTIRMLIADLWDKELYGKDGLLALDEADQEEKLQYPVVGTIYINKYEGRGTVIKVNEKLEQILVMFDRKKKVESFWLDQYYQEMKK